MQLNCGSRSLDLSQPQIMGILNTTPDSFSDGGNCYAGDKVSRDLALCRAEAMVSEGANIIDVGGESTRPGAEPVTDEEEAARVLPVVEALAREVDAVISVDTSNPRVITEAARLGAGILNDVRALQRPGALEAAAAAGLPVCLMHMRGMPVDMQDNPHYSDVVAEVAGFLRERMAACEAAGISREQILLDPGFGFGKTDQHNLALLNHLREFESLGRPLLVGMSRKSMVGRLLERPLSGRVVGSAGFALIALQNGAKILRVHDVAATRDMVTIYRLTSRS